MYEHSGVLDLSRRRDSVETRKTPSPYTASSFSEGSPNISHRSPILSGIVHQHRISPVTHHHQLQHSPPAYPVFSSFSRPCNIEPKRETPSPSPPQIQSNYPMYHHEQRQPESHRFSPYMLQAATWQQRLVQSGIESRKAESIMSSDNVTESSANYPMVVGRDGKLARPFKAYPRDPLSFAASLTATEALMDNSSAEKYNNFRKIMLKEIHAANGGQPTVSNPKMRRTASRASSESNDLHNTSNISSDNDSLNNNHIDNVNNNGKDPTYFERRKKNNAAAKKSRDRRRIKEDEIAIRAAYLERENIELKVELAAARKQLSFYGVSGNN